MINIVITAVIVLIVGSAVAYIIKQKRSGRKCIGCPNAKHCASARSGCNCGSNDDAK